MTQPLSKQLRDYFDEINKLYATAVLDNNAPQIAELSKAGSALAKQIKEHELHEGKTITVDESREICVDIGRCVARAAAEVIGDREVSDAIMRKALRIIEDAFNGK